MNQTRNASQATQAQPYTSGPPDHPQLTGMQAAPIARTKQFWISFRSELDGQLYEGQFTTKKLSIKDLAAIGVRKVQLNGGYYYDEDRPGVGVDPQTDWMNSMISHLEIALIQAPMWFNVKEMIDGKLLGAVFEKVMEFENSFFRSSGESANIASGSQNVGSPESTKAGAAGSIAQVAGGEVPSSLEP